MNHRSKKILSYIASIIVIAIAALWVCGKFIHLGNVEFTDNAQIQQQIVPADALPPLRPYDLRHRFASELLQKWIDEGKDLYAMLPYMRTYMGHVRFEDTAYYIHLLPDRLLSSPGVDWEAIDRICLERDIWDS